MAISILYNIPSLAAENQLYITNTGMQNTLYQLSTGSRINSGADDGAGLAIANGLGANVTALTQSSLNATEGARMGIKQGELMKVAIGSSVYELELCLRPDVPRGLAIVPAGIPPLAGISFPDRGKLTPAAASVEGVTN